MFALKVVYEQQTVDRVKMPFANPARTIQARVMQRRAFLEQNSRQIRVSATHRTIIKWMSTSALFVRRDAPSVTFPINA